MVTEDIENIQGPVFLLNLFPGLEKYLPNFILNKWMKIDSLEYNIEQFKDFVIVST